MYKKSSSRYWSRLGVGVLCLSAPSVYADISGNVFTDFNLNGQLDSASKIRNLADGMDISVAVDRGVAGAEVRAECVTAGGTTAFGPATTDTNGQFTLPTPAATDGANNCVLQLSKLPAGYSVGAQASTAGSNVLTQFVSPTTSTANFALQAEGSYSQNNPDLATNRYAYGQQTPNVPFAGNNDVTNIFAFPYSSGAAGAPQTKPTGFDQPTDADAAKKSLALAKEVGSVFGLGWHPASKSLFSAAYMKAWTGFGAGGTGGIYRTNMIDPANPVTSLYADLNQIFPATPATAGDDPYVTGAFSPANPGYVQIADGSTAAAKGSYVASGDTARDNQNGSIAAAVGKVAFGDLDVSVDGKSLFAVNMANRRLYILPIQDAPLTVADAAKIASYDLPFASNCKADGAGAFNKGAFGLGEYNGDVYVATRCDIAYQQAQYSIFRFDRTAQQFSATPSLDYPTTTDLYGLHLEQMSDIVFDAVGNMTLAGRVTDLADRGAGTGYGVIRRACVADALTHTWTRESNGSCGGVTTAGKDTAHGPDGGNFFFQEWSADQSASYPRASYGGIAHIPGFLESAYTVADPFEIYSAGVAWVDMGLGDPATAGQRNRAYGFYRGSGAFQDADNRPVNGKNAALGDLEVLSDAPSIEIGNRVWLDTNSNGIQDAGEQPIAGVKVELFAEGANLATATPLATTLTDAAGYYVFSNDNRGYPVTGNTAPNDTLGATGDFDTADIQGGRASTASSKFGILSLQANTPYQLAVRGVDGANKQAALSTVTLTQAKQGTDTERDSDGGLVGNDAVANVTTLDAGNHYHAVDFGFKSAPLADLSLTKVLDKTEAKRGDTVVYTLTVSNAGANATGAAVTDPLPTGVTWLSDDGAGAYDKATGVWTVGELLKDASKTLHITVTVD